MIANENFDLNDIATELGFDLTGYHMPETEEELAELYGDEWKGWDDFFGAMKKPRDPHTPRDENWRDKVDFSCSFSPMMLLQAGCSNVVYSAASARNWGRKMEKLHIEKHWQEYLDVQNNEVKTAISLFSKAGQQLLRRKVSNHLRSV